MNRAELQRREADIKRSAERSEAPGYNSALATRAAKRMQRVDAMPPEYRSLVHEFGLEIVHEFLAHGVKKPSSIKHLIETVRGTYADGRPRFAVNQNAGSKRNSLGGPA